MKRKSRVLFLCLLASMLFVPWGSILYSQRSPVTKYYYGIYGYTNNGVYPYPTMNDNLTHYTKNGRSVLRFWSDTLGMNSFLTSHTYKGDDVGSNLNYFRNSYFTGDEINKLHYIYHTSKIYELGESYYLKFDYANKNIYEIVVNDIGTNITIAPALYRGTYCYKVISAGSSSTNSKRIVDNISVVGDQNNMRLIYSRLHNIVNDFATFYVKVNIVGSTSSSTNLTITMKNSNPGVANDNLNNQPFSINTTLTTGANSCILPFRLDKNGAGAYAYGPELTIDCSMPKGAQFYIQSIELYDDTGYKVATDESFLDNNGDLQKFINAYKVARIKEPLAIFMADEPEIGCFIPLQKLIAYLRNKTGRGSSLKTFFTSVNSDIAWWNDPVLNAEFDVVMKQFFLKVNPDYYAPDHYCFNDQFDYYHHVVKDLHEDLAKTKEFLKENGFNTILFSTLQAHSWGNQNGVNFAAIRAPTKNEMLAAAYLSFLHGFKGVMWWASEVWQDDVNNVGLYKYFETPKKVSDNISDDIAFAEKMFNENNMVDYKKDVMRKVSSFLNYRRVTPSKTYIVGDILADGIFNITPKIIGDGPNPTIANKASFTLGDIDRTQIIQADILNPNTLDIPSDSCLVGISYFTIQGDDAAYFLVANLSKNGSPVIARLHLKSTNGKKLIKMEAFSPMGYGFWDKMYTKNGNVPLPLPQDGIVLLRITNVDPIETMAVGDAPRGVRFGVARTTNGVTSALLDMNFMSNSPEDIVLNSSANSEFISVYNKVANTGKIYTDMASFRVTNPVSGLNVMTVEYKKFMQKSDGTFNSPTTHPYTVPVPYLPSTSASLYKIGALAYDSNNDGLDELGYYVAYNNRYYIYTLPPSGSSFQLFRTYQVNASEFSKDSYVLGSKWDGWPTFYVYNQSNHYFYLDKDRDGVFDLPDEKVFMGWWYAAPPIPYTADWFGANTWEYGTFEYDKEFDYICFKLNYSHLDYQSYFEFPMGITGDRPIAWKPITLNAPKSNGGEVVEEEATEIPSEYSVSQNFPNPFNPTTRIQFSLPTESRVTLEVFNILGERVTELLNEVRQAGTMEVQFNGSSLPSGIYIYRFRATSIENGKHYEKINKMMLLK